MTETQRNFLIIFVLAVVGVVFSQQFATTAFTVNFVLGLLFTALIIFAVVQWRRSRAGTIGLLPRQWRWTLDASIAVLIFVMVTGTVYPSWSSWGGMYALAFFTLLAACALGIYTSWQQRNSGW